jgi:hypothetical protein
MVRRGAAAALNLYYDLEVLSPTRYEIGGKVRLVGRFFHLGGHCHLKEREALLKAEASLFFW